MLLELKVSNFAIIENISLSFRNGLNILSGETGAGKSVLLKSLTLLMGDKSSSQVVRSGCEMATVEGSFDLAGRTDILSTLNEHGILTEDDLLIVRRLISRDGKSRIYINESLSTLTTLQNIVYPLIDLTTHRTPLIEMTSQHENKNLMSKNYHMDVLDYFCNVLDLRKKYFENYCEFNRVTDQIEKIRSTSQTEAQRLDFLKYQRDEIKSLGLQTGDEEQIENEYLRIKNSSQLSEFTASSERTLSSDEDSVVVKLHKILQRSQEYSKYDDSLKKYFEPIAQAKTLIEEATYDLRSYGKEIDSEKLSEVEDKMNKLRHLQRKYGKTADNITKALVDLEKEIDQIENAENHIHDLTKRQKELELVILKQSQDLHKKRSKASDDLATAVIKELKDLNMKDVQFKISLQTLKNYSPTGKDEVEFLFRSSTKEEFRSIAKFASGGELSRILLSIKKVVGSNDLPRTYLFDEVDTGVSGPTAEKVGRKLRSISKGQQVICVTHLPQVAACGDVHFLIEKESSNKKGTQMHVIELDKSSREKEIARLISGEKISKTSLDHAKQLLKESLI